MAFSFSANQYEDAFWPHRICNWEIPHPYRERPRQAQGFTRVLSDERSHLLPGVLRSSKNPWGNFVGTWDLPGKLPGPRVFVPTARRYDTHDKLVREFYKLQPYINGDVKNGCRNLRQEDVGHNVKKTTKLGSVSPSHKEPCKDLEPFITRSPHTPTLDPATDDYKDDKCDTKSCSERDEFLNATSSPPRGNGRKKSPVAATQCGIGAPRIESHFSNNDKKAICSPQPENLLCDVTKRQSPMQIPSPDKADAFAQAFQHDDERCTDVKPYGADLNIDELPKCVKFSSPPPCPKAKTVCHPLHNEFTQPVTESSAEYLTVPMRLVSPTVDMRADGDTVFAL